jgi:hypothetical protein
LQKKALRDLGAELVGCQVVRAGEQAESVRLDDGAGGRDLGAGGAVAAAGTGGHVDLGLEAHRPQWQLPRWVWTPVKGEVFGCAV